MVLSKEHTERLQCSMKRKIYSCYGAGGVCVCVVMFIEFSAVEAPHRLCQTWTAGSPGTVTKYLVRVHKRSGRTSCDNKNGPIPEQNWSGL